jgi:hypothetical protein
VFEGDRRTQKRSGVTPYKDPERKKEWERLHRKDLNEAIAWWSKHPAMIFDASGFEIRPIVDMTALRDASKQRRKAAGKS